MHTELKKLKILVVEDNLTIARQVTAFLEGLSWSCDFAHEGKLAVHLAQENVYDVVLLDLNLPDMDGLEVCRQMKATAVCNMPVLMLTARDAFEDKASGFAGGADDYLTKPFDLRELALRCQALARRQQLHINKQINLGPLLLLPREMQASYQGQALGLTQIGFKILLMLVQQYPRAVSRSVLLQAIWGDAIPESDALKSHIYSLRKQLEGVSGRKMLATIHQIGYQLQLDEND
ncbi:response regulator transcription factor [Undibacterium umbellatum]|jgi:DNA-binding response OmpR family regulator|uniref:Response regulator transcription factor n=1 Tax=Undibacterium umbellatum TaxID=2762300 RepID=A0ABR6ZHZ2_9BURK|nr:response regulator transcription factor [Undibacterium umbellatum]MBC3910975.1 response regulator transcription factor [Undibacterium umbellatum]